MRLKISLALFAAVIACILSLFTWEFLQPAKPLESVQFDNPTYTDTPLRRPQTQVAYPDLAAFYPPAMPQPEITPEPAVELDAVDETTYAAAYYAPVTGSSTISDADMLAWIINHESHGNVDSINGIYKGIGQLQDQHYEAYVGMSYEETLSQPDPYAVQQDAMLGYINDRYGSVEAAYEHAEQFGWY